MNVMIGHDDVNDVVGAALGHVAVEAGGHLRGMRGWVAIAADRFVMPRSFGGLVRIVTGGAGHLTLFEASRFSQPVGGVINLECVRWRELEKYRVILQGLAGFVSERRPIITADRVRGAKAGGL